MKIQGLLQRYSYLAKLHYMSIHSDAFEMIDSSLENLLTDVSFEMCRNL